MNDFRAIQGCNNNFTFKPLFSCYNLGTKRIYRQKETIMAKPDAKFEAALAAINENSRLQGQGEKSDDSVYDAIANLQDKDEIAAALQALSTNPQLSAKGQQIRGDLELRQQAIQKTELQQQQIKDGLVDMGKSAVNVAMQQSGQLTAPNPTAANPLTLAANLASNLAGSRNT